MEAAPGVVHSDFISGAETRHRVPAATRASTTTGTSTAYIFHGDTLVAYIEQRIANGRATGTDDWFAAIRVRDQRQSG